MLEVNAVDLIAPLDDFNMPHMEVVAELDQAIDGGDEVEVIDEAECDARVGRTRNYTEMEDVCLIQAWESVSLDAVVARIKDLKIIGKGSTKSITKSCRSPPAGP